MEETSAPTNKWPTILAAGVLAEIGLFMGMWIMFDSARMAAGVLVSSHVLIGVAVLVWQLASRTINQTVANMAECLQIQAPAPMRHGADEPPVEGEYRQLPAPTHLQLPPPIAPGFKKNKTVRVLLTDGTLPEVEPELIKAFIEECYPACIRENWKHTNAEYGQIARVLTMMRGAPLVEYQRERYKWDDGVTREALQDWYDRLIRAGVDA